MKLREKDPEKKKKFWIT